MKQLVKILAAGTILVLAACAFPRAGGPPRELSDAARLAAIERWPESTPGTLERGRHVMLAKCNRCHGYPIPSDYTEGEWSTIVPRMARKAEISDTDRDLVLRYVLARRAEMEAQASSSPAIAK